MYHRFLRSSTFRLALVYMLLFGGSVLVLLGFIYWSTISYMTQQTDDTIEIEILDLTNRYRNAGLAGLTQLLNERLSRRPAGDSVYLLTDPDLDPLIGNLDRWPVDASINEGWLSFMLSNADDDRPHLARARLFRLSGGFMLLVGRDIHTLEATKRRISLSLYWGLGIMLVLGAAGSLMMARSTLHRIEAINQASRDIISGDLGRRVPSRNTGDEFDMLADNLNNMLDQIEALMESVRRVSDNIAHDLRTPLARLRNRLEELQMNGNTEKDASMVEQAIAEADGLLHTFNALLRIARIEAREDTSDFGPVELARLIDDVRELYEPLAEQKQLTFDSHIETVGDVTGDRDLLFQAVANLVDNAIKYTPAGGRITLDLENSEQGTRLRVCDNGPGIPEDQHEKVFQRFYRLEQSRTTPGNGLGMSLVQAVAQLHRLGITLYSNRPGLCVAIHFPSTRQVEPAVH